MIRMKIGVNTFGIGKLLSKDFDGTLDALKEIGITSIEPNIDFKRGSWKMKPIWFGMKLVGLLGGHFPVDKAGTKIEAIRKKGFAVNCIQADNIPWNVKSMQIVVDFCQENKIRYVVASFKEGSVEAIREKIPEIKAIVNLFEKNGIKFLAHNHEVEFQDDQGTNVMTVLLDEIPNLGVELDLGWAEYAGVSSVEFMKRYGDRIPLLHIKEMQPGKITDPRASFCVTPGTGILPLAEILAQSKHLPLDEEGYIIDQDNSVSGDVMADMRDGIVTIRKMLENQ